MQTSLFANKSELFKAAHKVTKVVLSFNAGANYQVTFGQVLKAMIAFNVTQKTNELKAKLHYNSRFGQKSELQITQEVMVSSLKYDVESAASHVINSIPQNVAKTTTEIENAAAYYNAKGGVTMC